MSLVTLYQFPISHYCEKVRWALDFKGISYEVVNLLPLWHVPRMMILSRQTQVPVVTLDGNTLNGSSAIVAALEARFPASQPLLPLRESDIHESDLIEQRCDKVLGPHVRRACYFHILQDSAAAYQLLAEGQSLSGKVKLKASMPLVIAGMRKAMHIHRHGYLESLDRISETLEFLSQKLGRHRYFSGNHLSAVDITVASLLAPLARPPLTIYASPLLLDQGFHDLISLFNHHPMINWTRRTYAQHRWVKRISPI